MEVEAFDVYFLSGWILNNHILYTVVESRSFWVWQWQECAKQDMSCTEIPEIHSARRFRFFVNNSKHDKKRNNKAFLFFEQVEIIKNAKIKNRRVYFSESIL